MTLAHLVSTSIPGAPRGGTSPAIDTTGADLLVIISGTSTTQQVDQPTDSYGNTWTDITKQPGTSSTNTFVYYVLDPIVGPGHTFTATSVGTTYLSSQIGAFSGEVTYAGRSGIFGTASATTMQLGSVTAPASGCLVIATMDTLASGVATINDNFTIIGQSSSTSGVPNSSSSAYLLLASGSVAPLWTLGSTQTGGAALIAEFTPVTGSAASTAVAGASTPLPQVLVSGGVSASALAQAGTPAPGVLGTGSSSSTTATASASTPVPRALSTSTVQTAGSGAAATPVPRALVSAYSQTTATAQAGTPRPTAAAYSSLNTYGAGLAGTPVPGASGSGTGTSISGLVRASTPVPGALGSGGSTTTGIGRAGTPLPGILALSTIPVQAIALASTPLPGATGFGLGYLVEENPAIGGTVSFAGSRRTISMAETSRSTSLTRAPRFVRFT